MISQSPKKILSACIKSKDITELNLVRKSGVSSYKIKYFLNGGDIGVVDFTALVNACGYQLAFNVQNGLEAVEL